MPPLYAKPHVPRETHSAPSILEPYPSAHAFSRRATHDATYPAGVPHEAPRPGTRRTTMIVKSPFVQAAQAVGRQTKIADPPAESGEGSVGKSCNAAVQTVLPRPHVTLHDAISQARSTQTQTTDEVTPAVAADTNDASVKTTAGRLATVASHSTAAKTKGGRSCYENALAAYTDKLLADARRRCGSAARAKARSRLRRQQLFQQYSATTTRIMSPTDIASEVHRQRREGRANRRERQPWSQPRPRSAARSHTVSAVHESDSSSDGHDKHSGTTSDDESIVGNRLTLTGQKATVSSGHERRCKDIATVPKTLPCPTCGAPITSTAVAAARMTMRGGEATQPSPHATRRHRQMAPPVTATRIAATDMCDEKTNGGARRSSPSHPIWLTPHLLTPPRPLTRHEGECATDAALCLPQSKTARATHTVCDPATMLATVARVTGQKGRPLGCHCDEWLQNDAGMHANCGICEADSLCFALPAHNRHLREPASAGFVMFPWDHT